MELYYFRKHGGNFGDALNAWLWERLIPGAWQGGDDVRVSGIGTIVNHLMPNGRRWVIFGSGVGYGAVPKGFGGPQWTVLAVRGPLSAQALSIPAQSAVTDGAMLLSLLPEFQAAAEKERHGVVFMPHYMNPSIAEWKAVCAECGIEFLDPCSDSVALIHRLRTATLVVADAMHAAIVADAMRTPWVPITLAPTTNSFKWTDWASSMDLPYHPIEMPFATPRDAALATLCRLYFEDDFRPGASANELMRRFAQRSGLVSNPVAKQYRRVAKRLSKSAAATLNALAGRGSRDSDGRKAECVAGLERAARSRPYLSSDTTFSNRQAAMAERLDQLRSISAASPALSHATEGTSTS